jgi:hypothetical protein
LLYCSRNETTVDTFDCGQKKILGTLQFGQIALVVVMANPSDNQKAFVYESELNELNDLNFIICFGEGSAPTCDPTTGIFTPPTDRVSASTTGKFLSKEYQAATGNFVTYALTISRTIKVVENRP